MVICILLHIQLYTTICCYILQCTTIYYLIYALSIKELLYEQLRSWNFHRWTQNSKLNTAGQNARAQKMQNEKELIPLSGKWAEPAPVTVGGRARARARALSRKSKARNQQNLENFNGNLSFDQRGKLFSFSFSTKRAFRKYRSCPYRGERTTFLTSYLKTHQKIILFQIRSDDQNPRRETGGLISKLHVVRRKHQNQGFPNTYKTTYPPSWAHPGAPWGSLSGPWALPAAPKRTLKFFARILIF